MSTKRKVGRPKIVKPQEFDTLFALASSKNSSFTHKQACKTMNMSYSTYFKLAKTSSSEKKSFMQRVKSVIWHTLGIA